ncbi:hypothetical protein [Actinacidiphila oryziradicis]|uniref:Uncharacterized protein n=1 Tax=Actinacidiphila oryziradicis TaxID=2571141 RepID=A0A4U0SJJ9_9ACTN|nr:hypothetical protein [Actinacidiphila oryziradicis]TKA08231.1 hypothetical protein FCI23_29635 [Actinacidiphila oryziradicis]
MNHPDPQNPHRRDRDYERAMHHFEKTEPLRADLTAFATALAERLPGEWTTTDEDWSEPSAQYHLAGYLWDNSTLSWTTSEFRVQRAALLTAHDFTQLLVIDRPLHLDQFLVGALAPLGIEHDYLSDDQAPHGIAVSSQPPRAAHAITTRLLPRYRDRRNALRLQRTGSPARPASITARAVTVPSPVTRPGHPPGPATPGASPHR